ncbi:31564_t:CDS:2, partial [Racocetra persica]
RLAQLNITQVDGFLFDLGLSSEQLEDIERGFSYRQSAPLDMRMNQQTKLTAQEIINNYIRQKEKITTTQQLVSIIIGCFSRKENKHPARRVFQALRIAVNQELINLSQGLEKSLQFLNVGGKAVVISYHSLEDRIVKQIFKKYSEFGNYQILTKKPLIPSEEEIITNHRARSAKMRELRYRVKQDKINTREVTKILKEKIYRQGCRLANQDKERDKEIAEWDEIVEGT